MPGTWLGSRKFVERQAVKRSAIKAPVIVWKAQAIVCNCRRIIAPPIVNIPLYLLVSFIFVWLIAVTTVKLLMKIRLSKRVKLVPTRHHSICTIASVYLCIDMSLMFEYVLYVQALLCLFIAVVNTFFYIYPHLYLPIFLFYMGDNISLSCILPGDW